MMGYAERARRARDQLEVTRYRVRRWTAFEWRETDEESRADREKHLERIAGLVERKMIEQSARCEPSVKAVRVERVPQLLFEVTLDACDEADARQRAIRRVEKALSAKVPTGRGRREVVMRSHRKGAARVVSVPDAVRLTPPWGECEVAEIRGAPSA